MKKRKARCSLLQIPTDDPADIPAYLPFGGWNDCPDTQTQLAFTHYWRKSMVPSRRLLTVLTAWSFWWNAL